MRLRDSSGILFCSGGVDLTHSKFVTPDLIRGPY